MSVAESNPAIKEAWGMIKVLSGSERDRALAEAREKARLDLDSALGDARYEGIQKGLQEGLQKVLQEVARNALQKKMPHTDIADLTGLSLDAIKKLATELTQ